MTSYSGNSLLPAAGRGQKNAISAHVLTANEPITLAAAAYFAGSNGRT
ncbi:hypothetical protein AcetOrient_orf04487 [Acetobacter orientalis]|uniref:Uncharacterized protein n=1 Tax=Acetobacter orientalis TaxID=146474 RepID=A0A2Z5ZKJ9_9PROT|nr:hypothetical protein AcetOrient_orf04487 [Acetobacter orientalis]